MGSSSGFTAFLSNGAGGFGAQVFNFTPGPVKGVALVDINNDGHTDYVFTDNGGTGPDEINFNPIDAGNIIIR